MSDLECKVCGGGGGTLTVPDSDGESASEQACPDPVHDGTVTATPGQALSPDPADFAYHVRATAFNVLTGKMAGDEWSVPRSERDAIARAVVDAVEPLIRADERAVAAQEPHAAIEPLRADLEATLADWRDDAVYRPTDTRDEMSEHHAVTGCADTLAGILADHPDAGPKPAPELGGTVTIDGQTFPQPTPAPELANAVYRGDRLEGQLEDVRAVITEILAAFGPSGSGHTARVGMVQIAKWRTRAGLTS